MKQQAKETTHFGYREVAVEEKAGLVRGVFESTPDIVDVDDTLEAPQPRLLVSVDRERAARLGVSQSSIVAAIATAMGGEDVSYLHDENSRRPVPIRLELEEGEKADPDVIAHLRVRNAAGDLVPLSEVAHFTMTTREQAIYHKDLLPMVMVTGDLAGELDSPLYGMAAIAGALPGPGEEGGITQFLVRQPPEPWLPSLKWDGEWQITYETFRDMGLAYAVGLILIYLLVVAQFRSYLVPLVIMAPIPLTIIGILPGHAIMQWLTGAGQFTATSMIGMIALAGIIVSSRKTATSSGWVAERIKRSGASGKCHLPCTRRSLFRWLKGGDTVDERKTLLSGIQPAGARCLFVIVKQRCGTALCGTVAGQVGGHRGLSGTPFTAGDADDHWI